MEEKISYYSAIGKRKTAIAKLDLKIGKGLITVNNKNFKDYFLTIKEEALKLNNCFLLAGLENKYDASIIVSGGGISSQLNAISLALAKAICKIDISFRPLFSKEELLSRDSRIKERRKYGLKKARKASQYSKR
jgi:small subunit ribosomal protein S9